MASTPSSTPFSELTNLSLTHRKQSASPFEGERSISTRHVKLNFDLFSDGVQHAPSCEQSQAIMELFPTSFKISLKSVFLIVACIKLPAKPWPTTVAGLPLYLTTDADAEPMDCGLTSRGPKLSVDSSITRWHTPSMQAFQQIHALLDSLNANINRIQWIGWSFLALAAKAPYPGWRSRLPFLVNDIRIGYIFREQVIQENALRNGPASSVRNLLDIAGYPSKT